MPQELSLFLLPIQLQGPLTSSDGNQEAQAALDKGGSGQRPILRGPLFPRAGQQEQPKGSGKAQ